MNRDAMTARVNTGLSGLNDVGQVTSAGVPQGGDFIDVDAEFDHASCSLRRIHFEICSASDRQGDSGDKT